MESWNSIGSELPGFALGVIADIIEEDSSDVELVKCIRHTIQDDADVVADIVYTGASLNVHDIETSTRHWDHAAPLAALIFLRLWLDWATDARRRTREIIRRPDML